MPRDAVSRSLRARATIHRMVRRRSRMPDALRWTSLASIWVHLGGLVLLALAGASGARALGSGSVGGPMHVSLLSMPGDADGGGVDDEGAPSPGLAPAPGVGVGVAAGPTPHGAQPPEALAPRPHETDAGSGLAVMSEPRRDPAAPPPPAEPMPTPEDADWQRFVRTEERDAVADAPASDLISAFSTHTADPRRAAVTSDRIGPLRPRSDGSAEGGGRRTSERRDGNEASRMGNRVTTEHQDPIATGGGGGGHQGLTVGEGAVGASGPRLEGGAAAAAAAGGSTGVNGGGGGPLAPPRSARPAPRGDRALATSPGWWKPLAVRVVTPAAPVAALAAAPAPAVTRGETRSLVERPGHRADTGGTDRERAEAALPDLTADVVGLYRVEPPGTADPVEELREALGFGPLDRDQLRPRPEWAGSMPLQGRADSSPQAVVDDVPIDWQTSLSTAGTPLGAWVQRAEELIAQRWHGADLDPHERAIGLQGQVAVRYLVHPSGRVTEVHVARSSGNVALDRMAIESIPDHLPRLPRELRDRALHHQITLRYRNPLVATGVE